MTEICEDYGARNKAWTGMSRIIFQSLMISRRTILGGLTATLGAVVACKTISPADAPTPPEPFGYKMQWISVRSERVDDVVRSLSLRSPRPASWRTGIDAVYSLKLNELGNGRVFVAPPISGWVSIIGFPKSDFQPRDQVKSATERATEISNSFGTTCSYATHRVSEYHHWILASNGEVRRCFVYSGDQGVLSSIGPLTPAERALPYANKPEEAWMPDQKDVMIVARGWSYDPTALSAESGKPDLGVIAIWD
jgi:hypothetical protein